MKVRIFIFLSALILLSFKINAEESSDSGSFSNSSHSFSPKMKSESMKEESEGEVILSEKPTYFFQPQENDFGNRLRDQAIVFGVAVVSYPTFQPEVLNSDKGSWTKYRKNFGRVVFDQDEPFWNFFVHPLTGSQMYLFYRARGYEKFDAFKMTFISSLLFEFTIEVYSEPASAQDIFNTPVLGTILGVGIEKLSFKLLNSGNSVAKFFGHLINPFTLFWFYEGESKATVTLLPEISAKKKSLNLVMEF